MKNIKICLFGRHRMQVILIELLEKLGFQKPIIILDKDSTYLRDKKNLTPFNLYGDIEKLERLNKVKIFKNIDINSNSFIKFLKKNNINFGFSISSRTIFKKKLIDYFKGNFFNLHDSLLPKERGGGLNSWRILLNRKKVGNTIHIVDTGIDTGEIILQSEIKLKKKYPKPIDYDYAQLINVKNLLKKFLLKIKNNFPINKKKQNIRKREYFARLYTNINGALDVDLPPIEFEKFTRAFSEPYEGAWIYALNKYKIHIKDIQIVSNKKIYPFFANGRVLKKDNVAVYLIVGGGLIKFNHCYVNGKKHRSIDIIKINDILRNSVDQIFISKNSIVNIKNFK